MKSVAIWTVCVVLGTASLAFAQGSPAHQNIAGRGYRPPTAKSYHQSAKEHAKVLSHYGQYKTIPAEAVQEHASEVKRNVEAAKKEFAKLDELAKQDPEVAKSLKVIHEHQAKALDLCKMVESTGAKDAGKLSECCAGMHKELEAAEAEHAKLIQHLKLEAHDAPAKK